MKDKPAGWYRNAEDRRQHGYWDGQAWDESVSGDAPPEPPESGTPDGDAVVGDSDYSD